ncbi:hypothetical protein Scep_009428 [Stephania cephalantha]|uniref:IRG-type G domain-containing protein n=1 Tax=Stephania cephalantha TaxID=152367 RepID=A0AAP0PD60_9MAGN
MLKKATKRYLGLLFSVFPLGGRLPLSGLSPDCFQRSSPSIVPYIDAFDGGCGEALLPPLFSWRLSLHCSVSLFLFSSPLPSHNTPPLQNPKSPNLSLSISLSLSLNGLALLQPIPHSPPKPPTPPQNPNPYPPIPPPQMHIQTPPTHLSIERDRHRLLRIEPLSAVAAAADAVSWGFKRPEIKVPTLVLQVTAEEVLRRGRVLEEIDVAVSEWVGVVVLDSGSGGVSAGRLYEAARLLKEVVKDRAFFLVDERVDIAAAVGASGVVLSDQGLPAVVARNMMMESKSDYVVLPIVARKVQTENAALIASNSEGADFLIYSSDKKEHAEVHVSSLAQNVKIPVFSTVALLREDAPFSEASKSLQSGASGLVVGLEDVKLFSNDALSKLFLNVNVRSIISKDENKNSYKFDKKRSHGKKGFAGFIQLEDREKQLIEVERMVLLEAISVMQKAAPLMEEVSILNDAVSQLNDPFLLVIVGEFNSGKSSVINALLGTRYLREGVVPTTNEITLLRYSEMDNNEMQRCERHPDGQFICYLPSPILKEMNLVDTPGTNVILQRQQRLTEEFVPRADLILFVISADRPLTESEVAFLRYIQQWKKKVVFVLNKSDLYQNASELEEAIAFIKDNVRKLLNAEYVTVYPVSARSAIEAKLSALSDVGKNPESYWKNSGFIEFEQFLFSFLDGSTDAGKERMKLKLGTPLGIADRLLATCQTTVRNELECACQDLVSVNELVSGVKDYAIKMESECISWRKNMLLVIDNAQARAVRLIESTLRLSNLDLVASSILKGEGTSSLSAASSIQKDIIEPALSDAQKLLKEYFTWLQSNNSREGKLYKETLEKKWSSLVDQHNQVHLDSDSLLDKREELSLDALKNFSPAAATKLFEQEIREVVLGTFGGLGAAGLSASLLTSVLETTLEDLLALGLCSAGGLLAVSNFPARRKEVTEKIKRSADALARELEDAMLQDLKETIAILENFVKVISEPYMKAVQQNIDRLLEIEKELVNIDEKMQTLRIEIQNLHLF